MSKEIHFLEDGYYVDKLEKEIQLGELRNNKTDYTKVNILEMQLDKYKKVINEVNEYIENYASRETRLDIKDILDKVKNV